MDFSKAVRSAKDGTEVDVVVSPHSNTSGIQGMDLWRNRIIVRIRAPPEGGKANKELLDLMETVLGNKVELGRGSTTRMKTIVVQMDRGSVIEKLGSIQ